MTEFLLIRHGEPNWELKDRHGLAGALRDFVPLTERGKSQAYQLSQDTRLDGAQLILSSPYTRSLQTASILSRHLQLPLQVEFDLHEWTPDRFEAKSLFELDELYKDYLFHNGVPQDGTDPLWETKGSVMTRCMSVLNRYLKYDKVAVVAHGMVIRILMNLSGDADIVYAEAYSLIL